MKNKSIKFLSLISFLILFFKVSNAENITITVADSTYYTIDKEFYGIQYHRHTFNNANATEKLQSLNLERIRIWANVDNFHPDPTTWMWDSLDKKIEEIKNANYKIIVGMDECKEWFIGNADTAWWNYSEGVNEWRNAVHEFINRYKNDLDMIIIFDEPNTIQPEKDYYMTGQQSAQLYIDAVKQIRTVDSTILCGGPSVFGGWGNGHWAKYVLAEPNGEKYLDFISCNIFLSWDINESDENIMNKTIWYEEAPMKIRQMLGNNYPPQIVLDAYNASALWEDGTDPRNTTLFGGIYNIATLLHSAKGGFDITLRWETLGGFGILNWYPNFNELPPYYAMQFLINTANLIEYSEIIKCETTESPKTDAPHHGGMNVNLYNIQPFAIKVNDDKINVILINKYANDTTVVVNIPNGMQSYSLFRYDSSRIINCSTPLITENVEDTITVNCPKYSATVLQFASDKINNIENDKPQIWDISQNFPNPFNNSTTIQYAYPYNFKINITIYNLLGKKVFTLINEKKLAGQYETTWNGKNSDGEIVPAGIYFYKTKLNNITKWKKMVFVK